MNKPLLLKALSKAYLVLNIKETEGFSVIHCSLNPKIVEMFCGNKTFNINNTNDTTVVTVVDLKNELAIDIYEYEKGRNIKNGLYPFLYIKKMK
jgi:hypothetical protein